MTDDTELDALVCDLENEAGDLGGWGIDQGSQQACMSSILAQNAADAITNIRAQLAEALADVDSWKNRALRQNEVANGEGERADRAEAALAAQIEADAGIADYYVKMRECQIADEKAKAAHHIDVSQLMRWGAGKVQSEVIATAIRAQPHDSTALDRMLRAEREKALRGAADMVGAEAKTFPANVAWAVEDLGTAILAMIESEPPNAP